MPLTTADIDTAVPPNGTPLRAQTNAVLKAMLAEYSQNRSLRNVATRCQLGNSWGTGNKQIMSTTRHVMRSAVSSLRLLYGAWTPSFNDGENDQSGQPTTYTCAIEYPDGVFTQGKFAGSVTGTATSLGEVITDEILVSIPKNTPFRVRTWASNTNGVNYVGRAESSEYQEATEFGATVSDRTMGGTITRSGNGVLTPYAILGISSDPSPFLLADSRGFGQADIYTNTYTNDVGNMARSIGGVMAYISGAIPGDRAAIIATGMTRRASLAKRFCTHVMMVLGVNDITTYGRTSAQVIADLQTIMNQMRPLPIFLGTIEPVSSSTDGWATTANQTTHANNGQRVAVNNFARGSALHAGLMELADQVESARDSGLWIPGLTGDGLHHNQAGYIKIANSRAIDVGRIN